MTGVGSTLKEMFKTKDGKSWRVPKVLLSGVHKKIDAWKNKHSQVIE